MLATDEHKAQENGMAVPPDAKKVVPLKKWPLPPLKVPEDAQPTEFGLDLLKQIDPEQRILNHDQTFYIARIPDEEALRKIIYADLGDAVNVDIPTAHHVFGALMRKIEIPQILMTWRLYTIVQCQNAIADGEKMMNDKSLPIEQRVRAYNLRLGSLKTLNYIILKAQLLAKTIGALKMPRTKSRPVHVPKHSAPTLT